MTNQYRKPIKSIFLTSVLAASTSFTGSTYVAAQFLGPAPDAVKAPQPTAVTASTPVVASLALLPGDLCEVQIFGIPQYDYKIRVDDDGSVALPLVGKLYVATLTVSDAEDSIAQRLIDKQIVKDPQVSLHVLDSPNHFATVTGEVKTPGPVSIYGEKRLLDVISAAGGLTPISSPLLTIYRRGMHEPFQLLLPADAAASAGENIVILPGDNIVVSKVGVVYILGAVHTQGMLPLKNTAPLSLIEAMALAGGVNYEAALKKAYILRISPDGRREIPFNVSDVVKHRVPDQLLQNEDIVLVPPNDMKAALKGGAAAVAASLLGGIGYITVR